MKKFLTCLLIFFSSICYGAELQIPFSCWPIQLQQEFQQAGLKLDFSSNERTKESFGYLVNEGSSYRIFTYKDLEEKDFNIIKDIVSKVELENR